jgi:hypothetical protein
VIQNLKALIVILFLALTVFQLVRPLCLRVMSHEDFTRRRNVWLAVTSLALLSPSFWMYAAGVALLLTWAMRSERHPVALYLLLLFAVPNVSVQLPAFGINMLFEVNHQRLLAFFVLLPAALRRDGCKRRHPSLDGMYVALLAYALLTVVHPMPYESITNTARRALLMFIDTVLVYHVVSRSIADRQAITAPLAMLALSCALMAPVAVFETLKGWLLYTGINDAWGEQNVFGWLLRGGNLRAQASAGHALKLGYVFAVGFCTCLYLQSRVSATKFQRWTINAWMWAGLLAAISRAPWLTAVVFYLTYTLLGPSGVGRMFKSIATLGVVAVAVLLSPLGSTVLSYLPFVGTLDSSNVTYRQALWETSVRLIEQRPWFGDPFFLSHMEHLRLGQGGIVDLMNGYAAIALNYGLVGLGAFLSLHFIALARCGSAMKRAKASGDNDLWCLGASLASLMIGSLFFAATAAFEPLMYVLAGLMATYSRIVPALVSKNTATRSPSHQPAAQRSVT